MLPKVTKNKKTAANAEQLDFVQPLDNEAKAAKGRRLVAVLLLITVGFSLAFWAYRGLKNFNRLSLPSLTRLLPSPKRNLSTDEISLDGAISPLIDRDTNYWSYYVQVLRPAENLHWSKNQDQLFVASPLNTIINNLRQIKAADTGVIKSVMPQGAEVKEIVGAGSNYYQISSLVSVPTSEILMIFKVSGSSDLGNSRELIPQLADKIYWTIISRD